MENKDIFKKALPNNSNISINKTPQMVYSQIKKTIDVINNKFDILYKKDNPPWYKSNIKYKCIEISRERKYTNLEITNISKYTFMKVNKFIDLLKRFKIGDDYSLDFFWENFSGHTLTKGKNMYYLFSLLTGREEKPYFIYSQNTDEIGITFADEYCDPNFKSI